MTTTIYNRPATILLDDASTDPASAAGLFSDPIAAAGAPAVGAADDVNDLLDLLAELVDAGDPPLPAPDRPGCRVAVPTMEQLRVARQALRSTAEPAAVVAHVVAEVLPYEMTDWPSGEALTGLRCAALYLTWRTGGRRGQVAAVPGRWPHVSAADWAWANAQLRTSRQSAARVEYVAWRLGTVLDRLPFTVTSDHAVQMAAARALFTAWRDELAAAERVRRAVVATRQK